MIFSRLRRLLPDYFLKPELIFITLALPFGIISAFSVPQLSVNDENMHYLKSYSLATGKLGANNCQYPEEVEHKAAATYDNDYTADYQNKVDSSATRRASCGSAASYTPIMHLPQAVGVFLANTLHPSTGNMVLLGRLANLLFFTTALFYIIKKVRIGKWAFAVIGLLPVTVHTAASLSADVMNNIIVLAFIALLFNIFTQKQTLSTKQTAFLLLAVGLLAMTKPTNAMLMLPLLFLPTRLFADYKLHTTPFDIRKWAHVALCGVVFLLVVVGWQKLSGIPLAEGTSDNLLSQNPLYFFTILANTYINPFLGYNDIILRGMVGEFASFRYHLPGFLLILCFVLLGITLLHKNKDEERAIQDVSLPLAASSVGALILLVAAVTYAMYTMWATLPFRLGPNAIYGDGVQGRYFTAALVLLIPLFIWLRRFINIETKSKQTLGIIVFSASALLLSFYTVSTFRFFS